MARQPATGPRPPYGVLPQNLQERLMPCAQFEAWERVRQARRKRGVDSDELTVQDRDKEDGEDKDDPQEEAALIEARIRKTTMDMFKQVLLFSQGAAEALYDDQMITTLDVLQDLTDNIIKELCCVISKPGGEGTGHQISELSP
jgi:hypothetical protein